MAECTTDSPRTQWERMGDSRHLQGGWRQGHLFSQVLGGVGPQGSSGGFPGRGAGRGALALEVLGVLEVSHACPFGPGLPGPSAARAARHAAGPRVSAGRRVGVVVAASTAADDG